MRFSSLLATALFVATSHVAAAQQGYEFEVYDAEIGPKGSTEIELTSNYVANGLKASDEGLYATHHALRSSIEFSQTLSGWLQGSVYLTTNSTPGNGFAYVGNRGKLTAVAPSQWHLPLDLALANEVSYARPGFAEYRWAYELTPILAKSLGPVTLVLNPAFERGLSGSEEHHIEVEPRGKVAFGFGDDASVAMEYYGGLGGIGEHYSLAEQRHQVFARFQTEINRHFEAGLGLGRGLTRSSDRWVLVTTVEYKPKH